MSVQKLFPPGAIPLHTEVLNIFIGDKLQGNARRTALQTTTCDVSLVNHNSICCGSRDKRQTVGELRSGGGVIECEVGQEVPSDGKQQGQVASGRSALTFWRKNKRRSHGVKNIELTRQTNRTCSGSSNVSS